MRLSGDNCELIYGGEGKLLAECDAGLLWVPSKTRPNWWDRLFCWWKPTHWPYWFRSWRRRQLVCIESEWPPDA